MSETILITGASGLLGRALVAKFSQAGFRVLAQYHKHPSPDSESVQWLAGDFSTSQNVQAFLRLHQKKLAACQYLINNFGPISERPTVEVTGRDLSADFELQVAPALDISRFLILQGRLRSVLNIGFEFSGKNRGYQKILGYALAKNALLLLTRSLAAAFPAVCFNLFSPPSLEGAAVLPKGACPVAPRLVAERIFRIMKQRRSGVHYHYACGQDKEKISGGCAWTRKKNMPVTGGCTCNWPRCWIKTDDPLARMATIAALLFHKFDYFFWCGFYRLVQGELIVGPYQGPLACQVLAKDRGVCWAGIKQGRNHHGSRCAAISRPHRLRFAFAF